MIIKLPIRKLEDQYKLGEGEGDLPSKDDLYISFSLSSSKQEVVGIRELEKELEKGVVNIRILEEDLVVLTEII